MSQRCHSCGRGARSGQRRSHSNIATKRKFRVNLQWRRLAPRPGATPVRTRLCTRCMKTAVKPARG